MGQVRPEWRTKLEIYLFPLQVPIFDGPMEKLGNGATYEELFVTCLKNFGVLCIGLYRFISFPDMIRSCQISFVCLDSETPPPV